MKYDNMEKKKQEGALYETPVVEVKGLDCESVLCASPDPLFPQLPDLEDGGDILMI